MRWRVLWLLGYPGQAVQRAEQSLREAEQSGEPLNLCFSLLYTAPVYSWCGDWSKAYDLLDRAMSHAHWHSLPTWHCTGVALKGESLVHRGDTEQGIALLRAALATMRIERQTLLSGRATCALAEALLKDGQSAEALSVMA